MMIEKIGKAAMLEQLAEEAAELSQAALKLARVLRGENPTPVTEEKAWKHLVEEYTDVFQCASELLIPVDWQQINEKSERFRKRWEEKKAAEEKDGNRHREAYPLDKEENKNSRILKFSEAVIRETNEVFADKNIDIRTYGEEVYRKYGIRYRIEEEDDGRD